MINKIIILVGVIVMIVMMGCTLPVVQDEPVESSANEITTFSFTAAENTALSADVAGSIIGTDISITLPIGTELDALVATFTTTGTAVAVGDVTQVSGTTANNFSSAVTYVVTAENGETKDYTITVSFYEISGLSPADDSATVDTSSLLSWDPVEGSTGYEVQIASTEAGVLTATAETVSTNSLTTSSAPAGFYWYWRVRAMDAGGAISAWSPVASLTLDWNNRPVSLTAPSTNSSTDDSTPELSWAEINGADSYEVYLAPTNDNDVLTIDAITVTTNSYSPAEALDNNTKYYYRVRAVATDANSGNTIYSAYSIVRNLTVSWGTTGPADGIRFAKELAELGKADFLGGSYTMAADIDLSNYGNWTPIGGNYSAFTGSFDGAGYTINGLTINDPDGSCLGLFGMVSGGTLKNITLTNIKITGLSTIGGLVGQFQVARSASLKDGIITNCHTEGEITASSQNVGGLIGGANVYMAQYSDANTITTLDITDSSSSCNVNGTYQVGGLIGNIHSGTTWTAYADNHSISISDCFSEGTVTATADNVGGLIGRINYDDASIDISGCYTNVPVSGLNHVGGLIGYIGIVTSAAPSTVSDCYALGDVTGTEDFAGGLVGTFSSATMTGCRAHGDVKGVNYVGGLAGQSSYYWGGQTYARSSTISQSFATGNVDATGMYVGGLIGRNGYVNNCYALGNVTGDKTVGGLCGGATNRSSITNCYSIGLVTGNPTVNGLAGSAIASFYNQSTSGQTATAPGVTPSFTTEMRTLKTYTDAGWDFANETDNGTEDVWSIDSNYIINNGYPYLTAIPPN